MSNITFSFIRVGNFNGFEDRFIAGPNILLLKMSRH